jgi:hypothetical protein
LQIFYKAAYVDCFAHNKEIGTNATMDEHVKLIAKCVILTWWQESNTAPCLRLFDDLIMQLDLDESEVVAMVKGIGQRHAILNARCGFNADIWEQLGEIAVQKICGSDIVQVNELLPK